MSDARWQTTVERLVEAQVYLQRALVKTIATLVAVSVLLGAASAIQTAYTPGFGDGDTSPVVILMLVAALAILLLGLGFAHDDWRIQSTKVSDLATLRHGWHENDAQRPPCKVQ